LSNTPEYIERLVVFLSQETSWNQSIVGTITSFLSKPGHTINDVDSLMMVVTKEVESKLRETLAKHLGRPLPDDKSYGTRLLDYTVDCHLIQSKEEPIYALLYLILKEPRNTSDHTFTNYPYKTIVMVISEANEALERIDTLIQPKYSSFLRANYDLPNKRINIEAQIFRPDRALLPDDQKAEVTLNFPNNRVKTVPLSPDSLDTWKGEYDVRGETCGTVSLFVRGFDNGNAFLASSGSSIPVYYPVGYPCPNCRSPVVASFVSICPKCGKQLEIT